MGDQEYPPLLGFHDMTLEELSSMCVDAFPMSERRKPIMDGLSYVLGRLSQSELVAEAWIDGSFLTEKINPDDSDVVIRVLNKDILNSVHDAAIDWLYQDLEERYLCHTFPLVEYEPGHPEYPEFTRAYWLSKFGYSREPYEIPKGIARVFLPLGGGESG